MVRQSLSFLILITQDGCSMDLLQTQLVQIDIHLLTVAHEASRNRTARMAELILFTFCIYSSLDCMVLSMAFKALNSCSNVLLELINSKHFPRALSLAEAMTHFH